MWRAVLTVVCAVLAVAAAYYRSPNQYTCVDIPRNLSLCHGIGYDKMRLPNLLDHDSVSEVTQQSVSWVPLQNVHCHPDTQLFLCSLFSPVCLDHPIYPCRSLCEKVRRGCEGRMRTYGFPWPEMFHCDKFPVDNDMCIASRTSSDPQPGALSVWADGRQQLQVFDRRVYPPKPTVTTQPPGSLCKICDPVETYENILDNFCTSDFVIRTRFKRVHRSKLSCKKVKILKKVKPGILSKKLRRPMLTLDPSSSCCEDKVKRYNKENFLVMGHIRGSDLVPSFIMRWIAKSSKVFKKAIRTFKSLNCTDPKFISHSVIGEKFNLADFSTAGHPIFTQKDIHFPFSTSAPNK
ncbi:secreted frizzled-related protein 5-like [Macrosteles quadrilineatus]|uniref:secreted frizzled-related protein 5-like n=1 Tax=Macrosteles quadrilineatus TaxID=74068 RepID=UPI0023E2C0F5|nr:secreted frizzled-related protein 5-like [Macrosteles quadrilineatus]